MSYYNNKYGYRALSEETADASTPTYKPGSLSTYMSGLSTKLSRAFNGDDAESTPEPVFNGLGNKTGVDEYPLVRNEIVDKVLNAHRINPSSLDPAIKGKVYNIFANRGDNISIYDEIYMKNIGYLQTLPRDEAAEFVLGKIKEQYPGLYSGLSSSDMSKLNSFLTGHTSLAISGDRNADKGTQFFWEFLKTNPSIEGALQSMGEHPWQWTGAVAATALAGAGLYWAVKKWKDYRRQREEEEGVVSTNESYIPRYFR